MSHAIGDALLGLAAAYHDFKAAADYANEAAAGLLKQFRKHPRPGWKPRRRLHKPPPPWRRAKKR